MAAPTPALYPTNKQFSRVTNSYSEIISESLQRFQTLAEASNPYLEHTTTKMYHTPAYAANASCYYASILSAIKNKLENYHSAFLSDSSDASYTL